MTDLPAGVLPPRNMGGMSALARLRRLGNEWQQRPEIIEQARAEKATWQEIADALHMTVHGVRKLHGRRASHDAVWVQRVGDGTWALTSSVATAAGKGGYATLHRFTWPLEEEGLEEIDQVIGDWGWQRAGLPYRDGVGATVVPVVAGS